MSDQPKLETNYKIRDEETGEWTEITLEQGNEILINISNYDERGTSAGSITVTLDEVPLLQEALGAIRDSAKGSALLKDLKTQS